MDDEFAAFEAEMSALASEPQRPPAAAGPRAPKVISSAPVRSVVSTKEETKAPATAATSAGGARLPVSQWPKPEELMSNLEGNFLGSAQPKKPSAPETSNAAADASSSAAAPAARSAAATSGPAVEAALSTFQPAAGAASALVGKHSALGWLYTGPEAAGTHSYQPVVEDPSESKEKAKKRGKEKLQKISEPAPHVDTMRFCAGAAWVDETLADWPEDDFRIFVGDLGNETNDDVLAHAFSRYPSFQKARVVRNKNTQKSQGYGFVSFKDPWDMTKALREMHGKYIGNRPVKVRKSIWKERSAGNNHKELHYSLAINDKKQQQVLQKGIQKKKPHVHKKKKGMPW